MISGNATFNMAAVFRLSLPCTFRRRVPKISWIRNLSSHSSGNGNGAKAPVSSLLEKLKSSSATEADISKLSDMLSTKPLPEKSKVTRRKGLSSRELKTGLQHKRADTEEWKYNKSLGEIKMQEAMSQDEKSLGISDSSRNGDGTEVPVSSLLEKLESSSATEADLSKLSDMLSTKPLPEKSKVTRRKGLSSRELKTGLQRERADTEEWKYNESLGEIKMQEAMSPDEKSLGISDSSRNGDGTEVPVSSLVERHESSSATEADLSKLSDMLSTKPLPEKSKVTRRKGLSSRELKTGLQRKRADTKEWKYNKILREIKIQEAMALGEKSLGISESGNLLSILKEAEQEPGQDNVNGMLEKLIEETRSGRKKVFQRTAESTLESTEHMRQRPQRVDKSLEDLDKSRLTAAERSKKDVDPSLNQKIRDLLSEVEIQPKQLGTAKTIVAAVENWGMTANHQRRTLKEEHDYQTKEMSSIKRPSGLMLLEGESAGLFDDVISKAKTADVKINNVAQSNFLYHLEELDHVDKIGYLGVKRNAFADQIRLSNRLWQYPIDNEVCKIEEENTSFEEHVFLEYLLDDFPSKGPVRRFMELVINGLQRNPFLSVEQKKERVRWFHDYFSNFSEEELSF